MRKKIVKVVLWAGGIFFLLFLIFFLILYINRDKLQQVVIAEINRQLAVPVDVSDVDISLRKFPSASILFTDVYSQGAYSRKGDTLIFASKIYLQFDIWKVLSSHVSINKISIEDAVVNIRRMGGERNNYQIWKEDTSAASGVFSLDEVALENVRSGVFDEEADLESHFHLKKTVFNGDFGKTEFSLKNSGELIVKDFIMGEKTYLTGVPVQLSFSLTGGDGSVVIDKAQAKLNGMTLRFGMVFGETVRLEASSRDFDLQELQELAAAQSWYINREIRFSGTGSAEVAAVFGGEAPQINVQFKTSDAKIDGNRYPGIKAVNCSGSYRSARGKDHFHIKSFSGKGKTGKISGNLDINDLSDPYVILNLQSDLDLAEWLVLFPVDTLADVKGKAKVDLYFENKFSSLRELKASELQRATARGEVFIEEGGFRFKNSDKKVENINGELSFSGNALNVKRLFFKTGRSDIFLEGIFGNILNFLLIEGQTLKVDSKVKSQEIHLQDFVISGRRGSSGYSLGFTRSLDLDLLLNVDRFVFEKFYASDISGRLLIRNNKIAVTGLSLQSDEGLYAGSFSIDIQNPEYYLLQAQLRVKDINVHDLFVSFNNFSQDAIAAENIYGHATASMQMTARMTPELSVLPASIDMTSELEIRNGNLKNYQPMMALSRFADMDELKNVQFNSLKNTISIHNSVIHIPAMEVESNVLDMQVSGEHNFNNIIDYNIRLKLEDVLFRQRRNRSRKSEFDEHLVEKEHNDDPYVYVKMYGAAGDPEIELDKKSLSKSISRDLKEQGRELREIFKKDAPPEKKENPGIIFEWPEEKNDSTGG